MPDTQERHPPHNGKASINWWLIGFLAIAAFFLLGEHRTHLLGVLPFLMLIACPMMHLFMHHGHGKGHRHE